MTGRNRQGSVLALADVDGEIVESYRYSAYGKARLFDNVGTEIAASAVGNPYGYTGRRLDPEAGLLYYRNRHYSPDLGRFLSRDPAGQVDGLNRYAYVRSNPLAYIDPWGLSARFTYEPHAIPGLLNQYPCFGDDALRRYWAQEETLQRQMNAEGDSWLWGNVKESAANTLEPFADALHRWADFNDAHPRLQQFQDDADALEMELLVNAQENGPTPDDVIWGVGAIWAKGIALTSKGAKAAEALDNVIDALTAVNRGDDAFDALRHADDVGDGATTLRQVPETHMHHQTPREVLKQLPEDVANSPAVRGKPGMPNRKKVSVPEHKRVHKGKGGGQVNELTKQQIRDLGREPTTDDVLRIRQEVNQELNIHYED